MPSQFDNFSYLLMCGRQELGFRAGARTPVANGRNSSKWTGPLVGLHKTLNDQNFAAKFLKNVFKWIILNIEGVLISHFLQQIVATP